MRQHPDCRSGALRGEGRRRGGWRFAREPLDEEGRGRHRHGRHGRGDEAHGGRGRHGRGGRPFDHGALRLVILALVAEQPRHGYELIKAIEERTGGSYSPSPGVVYPTLTLLDELGQATVEESGGKKLYSLTESGRQQLEAQRREVEAALARMDELRDAHGGGPAPELIRAMENLKLALRLRQSRGPLSQDELHRIVEALDAAAVAVERA